MVLLTWNEAKNVRACLHSLARQTNHAFEVLVLDAASTDRTATIVQAMERRFPVPLRLEVSKRRVPIGEARNHGVALARAPLVAFLSADAEVEPTWVEEALESLARADMVFSRQVHAPRAWTVGAAVRGLRYHFPPDVTEDPLRYASNVAAAYRKEVLQAFPFDAWSNAAEDILLAERAHAAGFRAHYNPHMVVHHHDVPDARTEMRKNLREGYGWAVYHADVGIFFAVLAWGATLLACLAWAALARGPGTLALLALVLYAPALRRGVQRMGSMPLAAWLKGVAASPLFDLAFLANYVRGLARRGPPPPANPSHAQETHA